MTHHSFEQFGGTGEREELDFTTLVDCAETINRAARDGRYVPLENFSDTYSAEKIAHDEQKLAAAEAYIERAQTDFV